MAGEVFLHDETAEGHNQNAVAAATAAVRPVSTFERHFGQATAHAKLQQAGSGRLEVP